jgi:hypothetical protein
VAGFFESLGNLGKSAVGAVGGLLKGTADTAVGILNSDSVEAAIQAGAAYAADRFGSETNATKAPTPVMVANSTPAWLLPAGIGAAAIVAVLLIATRRR